MRTHPLCLDLQCIAVAGLLPVVDSMLGVVPPASQVAADEADPHVAGAPAHLTVDAHNVRVLGANYGASRDASQCLQRVNRCKALYWYTV